MAQPRRQVLLAGLEESATRALAAALSGNDIGFESVSDREDARGAIATEHFDAILVWCAGHDTFCRELLADVAELSSESLVIAVAPLGQLDLAMALVRDGASDYLAVPFTSEEARRLFHRAVHANQHAARQVSLPPRPSKTNEDVTDCPEMVEALATADLAARSTTTVLIRGESGVGKEVLARRIHARSGRAARPFVKVHCAALPEQILESELFGYEKGAFTGAASRKPGRFELAEGGTIFLDEIGDISPSVQLKLLRVVQDREFERLGGTETLRADVRIITATHRNLEKMVKTGEFRQDLYYRLNVLRVTVPPLRSRVGHIARLARQFCATFSLASGRSLTIGEDAIEALQRAAWPGNVRQLQNVVERLVVLTERDHIARADVDRELGRDLATAQEETTDVSTLELAAVVRKAEKKALKRALERSGGNRAQAARILGVSRRTLFYKLREHSLG